MTTAALVSLIAFFIVVAAAIVVPIVVWGRRKFARQRALQFQAWKLLADSRDGAYREGGTWGHSEMTLPTTGGNQVVVALKKGPHVDSSVPHQAVRNFFWKDVLLHNTQVQAAYPHGDWPIFEVYANNPELVVYDDGRQQLAHLWTDEAARLLAALPDAWVASGRATISVIFRGLITDSSLLESAADLAGLVVDRAAEMTGATG